jgi:diguanylate cyclase (GGDEF)-like protein
MRNGTPVSLIMMDIDFFKPYNDTYGHGRGDVCLQQVASALNASVTRPSDLVAHYGGEEFVALLPDTDAKGAHVIAERIRGNVEALRLPHEQSAASVFVTISLGLASLIPEAEHTFLELLLLADQMLYRAKESGRNRVCHAIS